jgi:phenylacetate-CoA ligase
MNHDMFAARMKRVARRFLFGQELDAAQQAHGAIQWRPGSIVADVQWKQLSECVAYAREMSEFYRRRFRACEIGGELTPDAFRRITPLRREDVMSSWATIRTSAAGTGALRRRSGGSSGRRVSIPLDRATYCWYIAGTWRGFQWWGSDLADRGAIVLGDGGGGPERLVVRAKDWVMNWLRFPVSARFDEMASEILDRIARFDPTFIYGYPSAVHRLARVAGDGRSRGRSRLKVIVLTGEPLYAFQRRAIEQTFQCPVAEEYGNGEVGSMAFQCPEGTLHITAENVFLETAPTAQSSNGRGGPLLVTQLRNRLFPLIRYEIGDAGMISAEPCRCGRGLPAVAVVGRVEDQLVSHEGPVPARPRVERFLSALPDSLHGRVQVVHGPAGRLLLRVEHAGNGSDVRAHVLALGQAVFGPGWSLEAVAVEHLPRLASGKLPYFRSRTLG